MQFSTLSSSKVIEIEGASQFLHQECSGTVAGIMELEAWHSVLKHQSYHFCDPKQIIYQFCGSVSLCKYQGKCIN